LTFEDAPAASHRGIFALPRPRLYDELAFILRRFIALIVSGKEWSRMTKQFSRGVRGARRSDHRIRPWSNMPLSTIVFVLAAFVAISGCDKPPTFSELINGKKKEEKQTAPPPVAKASTGAAPRVEAPKAPEKPKRAPQEVVSEFNTTPPERRNNQQLIELAQSPEATDQYTDDLYLATSGVTDAGMAALPKFDKVQRLEIDGCGYTNNALINIAKMKSLVSLSMNGGSVADPTHNCDAGLAAIKEMHQLTSLSLEAANITPKGLAHIATMTWLESLNVARTRFNDDSLEVLTPLVNLKELNISYTVVSDNGMRFLLPFTQLEILKIAHIPIRGDGLRDYAKAKAKTGLRHLTCFDHPGLEQTGYEGIYTFRKTLEYLDVSQAALTDDRFLKAVAPCTKLEALLVAENPSFGDGGLSQIYKLKSLKRLYFYKNPGVTDQSIPQIAKLRKSLESVTFNATGVSEKGVQYLKKKLRPECVVEYNYKKVE
jgi:hypothetical protein